MLRVAVLKTRFRDLMEREEGLGKPRLIIARSELSLRL